MIDADIKILEPAERLEALLYQYAKLYDRWSEDRLVAAKQAADSEKLMIVMAEQIKKFTRLENSVREQIRNTIANSAKEVGKTIGEEVTIAAAKEIKNTSEKLEQSSHLVIEKLNRYGLNEKAHKISIFACVFMAAIFTGFVVGKWSLPGPYLTGKDFKTYQWGVIIENVWPKLSKKEQQKLLDIAKHPEKLQKSTEDDNS